MPLSDSTDNEQKNLRFDAECRETHGSRDGTKTAELRLRISGSHSMFMLYMDWNRASHQTAMKQLFDEFKAFIMRGNVIELAVAVVIGTAFTKLVGDATKFLIEPILGMVLAGKGIGVLDFTYMKLGSFLMSVINFAITAAVVFFLFVKPINKMVALFGKKEEPGAPPASLNDVVTELKEMKEELRRTRGGLNPLP